MARSRSPRGRPLTVRGVGALALGAVLCAVANVIGSAEALAFGMLLIALVACSLAWLHLRRSPQRISRTVRPEPVAVGDGANVSLRVVGRSALPTTGGSWHDSLPAGLSGEASGSFAAALRPRSAGTATLEATYTVTGIRRGTWTIGPLEVVEHDPFGIARRTRRIGDRTPVVVTPRVVALAPLPRAGGESGLAAASSPERGQGSDNLIPRPWAPGDSMRRVHWRASARLGDLMVREEEKEASPHALVVLDRSISRWAPAASAPGADPAFEAAVAACASAAVALARDGYAVRVLDAAGVDLGRLGRHDGVLDDERSALLRALATLGTRALETLPGVADVVGAATAGPLVLVAGRLDPSDGTTLARLARHASLPVVLAASPAPGALDEARRAGWRAGELGDDLARAWDDALTGGRRARR